MNIKKRLLFSNYFMNRSKSQTEIIGVVIIAILMLFLIIFLSTKNPIPKNDDSDFLDIKLNNLYSIFTNADNLKLPKCDSNKRFVDYIINCNSDETKKCTNDNSITECQFAFNIMENKTSQILDKGFKISLISENGDTIKEKSKDFSCNSFDSYNINFETKYYYSLRIMVQYCK
jgi:hypothetical protein